MENEGVFKSVIKNGLIMFSVGALLAFAAPYLGVAVGMGSTLQAAKQAVGVAANPAWMGTFFGAFGAVRAAIEPAISSYIFGDKPEGKAAAQAVAEEPAVTLYLNQEPEVGAAKAAPAQTQECPKCDTSVNVASLNVNNIPAAAQSVAIN